MKHFLLLIIFSLSFLVVNAQVREITEKEYVYEIFPNMDKPVIIDFYAIWCAPCHQYSIIFNEVANNFYGEANFYRVNIDENKTWAQQWKIEYIPTTILIYTKGEDIHKESGVISREKLNRLVQKAISKYRSDKHDYF